MGQKDLVGDMVLVRTYSAGVHFGRLAARDDRRVSLTDARRIWSWKGAWTLNEIAAKGVAAGSKVSCSIARVDLTEAIEILAMTPDAVACLGAIVWTL